MSSRRPRADQQKNGTQNVEVFVTQTVPPTFPATGTATHVFYSVGQPSQDIIPCTIVVNSGDYVLVLGACGTATMLNWYGSTAPASNVLGMPIVLNRLLTQFNIVSTGGNQPFSHEAASIARIEVYVAGMNAAIDYGAGTGIGTTVAPALTTTARPIIGNTGTLSLSQSFSPASAGAIMLSLGRANLALLGGTLLINPSVLVTITLPSPVPATTPLSIPIPNNPSLAAAPPVNFQGFILSSGSFGMSNGTEWWVGY